MALDPKEAEIRFSGGRQFFTKSINRVNPRDIITYVFSIANTFGGIGNGSQG